MGGVARKVMANSENAEVEVGISMVQNRYLLTDDVLAY
jgi:hypothetical protein